MNLVVEECDIMTKEEMQRRLKSMMYLQDKLQVLAELNGISKERVKLILGLTKPKTEVNRKRKMNKLHQRALALYEKGMTDAQIARELDTHYVTIKNWRKRYKLPSMNNTRSPFNKVVVS